jgi:hypothetical protein
MADDEKDTAAASDDKSSDKHEHSWQTFVEGDGNAAREITRCSHCLKEKK